MLQPSTLVKRTGVKMGRYYKNGLVSKDIPSTNNLVSIFTVFFTTSKAPDWSRNLTTYLGSPSALPPPT
jgi:hypothetical protein